MKDIGEVIRAGQNDLLSKFTHMADIERINLKLEDLADLNDQMFEVN